MIKKIFSAIMAVAMIASLASCAKDEISAPSKDMKINFSVGDMPSIGNDTRSVKKAWAIGDEILVMVRNEEQDNEAMPDQTITLEYTSTGWTATQNGTWSLTDDNNCVYTAIYHRGEVELNEVDGTIILPNYKGGEIFAQNQQGFATASGVINLGTIALALPSQFSEKVCQFSIPGLDSSKDWKLSIIAQSSTEPTPFNSIKVYYTSSAFFSVSEGALIYSSYQDTGSAGCYTGTDHIFWYSLNSTSNSNYRFYLTNGTDAYIYDASGKDNLASGVAYTLPALTSWIEQ